MKILKSDLHKDQNGLQSATSKSEMYSDVESDDEDENELSRRVRNMCDVKDFSDLNMIDEAALKEEEEVLEDWIGTIDLTSLDRERQSTENYDTTLENQIDVSLAEQLKSSDYIKYLTRPSPIGDTADVELRVLAALLVSRNFTSSVNGIREMLQLPEDLLNDVLAECCQEEFLEIDDFVVLKSKGFDRLEQNAQTISPNQPGPPLNPNQLLNSAPGFSSLRIENNSLGLGLGRGHLLSQIVKNRQNQPIGGWNAQEDSNAFTRSDDYQKSSNFDMQNPSLTQGSRIPSIQSMNSGQLHAQVSQTHETIINLKYFSIKIIICPYVAC